MSIASTVFNSFFVGSSKVVTLNQKHTASVNFCEYYMPQLTDNFQNGSLILLSTWLRLTVAK